MVCTAFYEEWNGMYGLLGEPLSRTFCVLACSSLIPIARLQLKGLHEKGIKDVTESHMYDVCKKVTPEKYLPQTLEILDGLKSK